ncbi:TPA: TIGR03761 family integrating conjugative element protein [Salmonella enterica]|nr:TIGR03761 family integrating conjugative element protein [Salmonella enterica]HDJ1971244.1 TIGR03761 family integrating conjugative element protein [Salmonella enterica subsp. enterica]HAK0558111.1 TIGR03761 family integrating conjugative element protein [Salmonella enterica]HAK1819626.1 TIGR03761 family integrating conjugative element protein [Salmonella enterica]HAK4349439.1 TIGR03761 family integrating conjugative element protein [Salmonella enterica]
MSEDKLNQKEVRAGALHSSLSILLHTHYAIRLWEGRKAEKVSGDGKPRPGIISMPQVIARAGQATRDAERDNPWADMLLVRLEEALSQASEQIRQQVAGLEAVLNSIPGNIVISDIASSSPVNIGVFSSSPLGYRCVWLLVGYDELVMKAFHAFHYGLISRAQRDNILDTGGHAVRKVYGVAQSYKTVHATRQDILSGTEKGRVAVSRFGQPDPDIMSGKKRSVFSPPLK